MTVQELVNALVEQADSDRGVCGAKLGHGETAEHVAAVFERPVCF